MFATFHFHLKWFQSIADQLTFESKLLIFFIALTVLIWRFFYAGNYSKCQTLAQLSRLLSMCKLYFLIEPGEFGMRNNVFIVNKWPECSCNIDKLTRHRNIIHIPNDNSIDVQIFTTNNTCLYILCNLPVIWLCSFTKCSKCQVIERILHFDSLTKQKCGNKFYVTLLSLWNLMAIFKDKCKFVIELCFGLGIIHY